MNSIPRRTLLTGAAAVAAMPITGAVARGNSQRLRDLVPIVILRRYGIEEHADRLIEPDTKVAAIDPETGASVTLV